MTSNVSGKRRSQPIHVPENDQIMGGFDGMSVKVALSTTWWFTSLQHISSNLFVSLNVTAQHDMANCTAVQVPLLGYLFCERACSVTSRALDVSRDKVLASWFNEG